MKNIHKGLLLAVFAIIECAMAFSVGGSAAHAISPVNSWSNAPSPVKANLYTVWGASASDIYAGGDGVMMHYNGTSWSVINNRCYNYRAIAGTSANEIQSVGQGGPLEAYNGAQWQKSTTWVSGNQYSLQALSAGNYLATGDAWGLQPAGASTPIMRKESGTWSQTPSSNAILNTGWTYQAQLTSSWAASSSAIWAGGENEALNGPVIYQWDGTGWQTAMIKTDGSAPIVGIWGSSASDIWAVGGDKNKGGFTSRRTIYHFNGSIWTTVASYDAHNNGAVGQLPTTIWGTSASDIWIAGENAIGSSFMHYDGTSWTVVPGSSSNTTITYRSFWGTSSSNIWAVGDGGNIMHFGSASANPGNAPLTDTFNCTGQRNGTITPSLDISVSGTQVSKPGATIGLTWRSTGADQVTIDGATVSPASAGDSQLWVGSTHTFSVIACNSNTQVCTAAQTANITMVNNLTASLGVNPSTATLPVATTTLTAVATVSDPGAVTFTLYCTATDSSTNVVAGYDAQVSSTTNLTQTFTVCPYASAGTYLAKVIMQQAGATAVAATTTIVRVNPTLFVNLTSASNSGVTPFTPNLVASVTSNQSLPITYTFYCNRSDNLTTVTAGYIFQQSSPALTLSSSACTYNSAGTYYGKIVVQQGSSSSQAQLVLTPSTVTQIAGNVYGSPTSGNAGSASIAAVSMIGSSSGAAPGPTDYYFFCVSAAGQSATSNNYDYYVRSALTSVTPPVTCNYSTFAAGTVTMKIIVVRGIYSSTYTNNVTLLPPDLSLSTSLSPTQTTYFGTANVTTVATGTIAPGGTGSGAIKLYVYCNVASNDTVVTDPNIEVASLSKKVNLPNNVLTGSYTCSYSAVGTYYIKVIAEQNNAVNKTVVKSFSVLAPSVSISSYTTAPTSGSASITSPLTVNLTTVTGGTSSGVIDYLFYCDQTVDPNVTMVGATVAPTAEFDAQAATTMSYACTYTNGGTYMTRVYVRRGGVKASSAKTSTYGSLIPSPPTVSLLINNSKTPIVQLGQVLHFSWNTTSATQLSASSSNWTIPLLPPVNCVVPTGCATAVADKIGSQVYYLQVVGPAGAAQDQITVQVVPPAISDDQIIYNYSQGL